MSHLSRSKPKGVEDVTREEAQHSQVEHVPALVPGKQKQDVADAMECESEQDKALVAQTLERGRQEKEVDRTQTRSQKRLCKGIQPGVFPPDGKQAEEHIEGIEEKDRILSEQHS